MYWPNVAATAGNVNSSPSVPPPLFALPSPNTLKSAMFSVTKTSTPLGVPPVKEPSNTPVETRALVLVNFRFFYFISGAFIFKIERS